MGAGAVKSTLFRIRETGNGVELVGRGFGHGVGMSQWGANRMAQKGYTCKEILERSDCEIGRRCVERYGFVPFGRTLIDQIAGPTLRAFLLFFFRSMRSLFLSFQMVCVRTKWQDFLKKTCQQSI